MTKRINERKRARGETPCSLIKVYRRFGGTYRPIKFEVNRIINQQAEEVERGTVWYNTHSPRRLN
jgi:hypothetical protein